jgi:hypothetical protein
VPISTLPVLKLFTTPHTLRQFLLDVWAQIHDANVMIRLSCLFDDPVMIYVRRGGTVPLYCYVPRQPSCDVWAAPPLIRIMAWCGRSCPSLGLKNTPLVWFELVREHGFKSVNQIRGT